MSSVVIEPSYMPVDGPATHLLSSAAEAERTQDKLALTIPTLREAENISGLLDHVRSVLDPLGIRYEILVVDDDSRDGTEEIVSAISRRDPRVRLLVRKGQRGLSGAILHGWQNTDAAILGVMDADLQHPPELLPKLIAAILAGRDLAIGSRYTAGGSLRDWNPVRKLISAAAVWVTWPIQRAGLRAKDPMSGFFFVRRECVEKIPFQRSGFKLLLEILVRGHIRSVEEIPFAFGQRYRGASKASFKVAVDYGSLLARLYANRLHLRRD
jgi:dolichol-phosphate mannosyltransferase